MRRSIRISRAPAARLTDSNGNYRFHHHQARRLSLAEPRQCLAAGAYPLLAFWRRFRLALDHADVFSRRPAARVRSDLSFRARRGGQTAPDRELRPGAHQTGMGARLSIRHRTPWPRRHALRGVTCSRLLRRPSAHSSISASRLTKSAGVWPAQAAQGERLTLIVRVLDGDGAPVDDAVIELWQADATFRGFGRLPTDEQGTCVFETVKPGRATSSNGTPEAPHIDVSVFARGLLKRAVTRIYFQEIRPMSRTPSWP